jgi:uncharacterized surface protein with fasciclin (FAS1) repeats
MVSLQVADSPWLTYGDASGTPESQFYVAPYRISQPSYHYELSLENAKEQDSTLATILEPYQNSFYTLYFRNPTFDVNDYYTIFYPMETPLLDELLTRQTNASLGFSYKDRKFKTDSDVKIKTLLDRHLLNVQIQPQQVEYRNTRLTLLSGETINIDDHGYIYSSAPSTDNRIRKYIKKGNVTVFFIDKEINFD